MQDKWYLAIEGRPIGPFTSAHLESMINNRSITFVDFVWHESFSEWKRIFEVGTFNHLLPQRPTINVKNLETQAMNINTMQFNEAEKPTAESPKKRGKKKVEQAQQTFASPDLLKSVPNLQGPTPAPRPLKMVRSFVADAIIHDDFKVYHGVVYGMSENELFVACKSLDLPLDKKLQIIVSSQNLKQISKLTGKVRAMSKFKPVGYSILLDNMPSEFKKVMSS